MSKRVYSLDEARLRIERYCTYQDRCHHEVTEKLRSFGLLPDTVDQLIVELMQQDFLNEERFARSFASGKFKIKKWGRIKIARKLREKRVSDKCIEIGLTEIEEPDYLNTMRELITKKWESESRIRNEFDRKGKVAQYLFSRGFESDLIWEIIDDQIAVRGESK